MNYTHSVPDYRTCASSHLTCRRFGRFTREEDYEGPTREEEPTFPEPKAQRLHSGQGERPQREEQFKDPGEAGKEETSPRELR